MSSYTEPRNNAYQNSAFYDAFASKTPPYNFYFNPTNVIYEPFVFAKRIGRLDFDLMGTIDVIQISKTGNVQAIMQLLHPIVFANITQVEAQEFGSMGALHSFMILQMAVEYYLNAVGKLNWEIHQLRKQIKPPEKLPPDQRTIARYESEIQMLKSDVEKRDMIIDNLSEKYSNVRRERDSLKCQLESLKKRTHLREFRPQAFEEEEDLSVGEVKRPPEFDQNPSSKAQTLPKKASNPNGRRNLQKEKQKTLPNRRQHNYWDLNSRSSQSQSRSNKEHKTPPYEYTYSSSSGWT